MTNTFVKPVLLRDATIDQISKSIIDKSLKPGDRLPTEQEWSQKLGVSRLTVREALKSLDQDTPEGSVTKRFAGYFAALVSSMLANDGSAFVAYHEQSSG